MLLRTEQSLKIYKLVISGNVLLIFLDQKWLLVTQTSEGLIGYRVSIQTLRWVTFTRSPKATKLRRGETGIRTLSLGPRTFPLGCSMKSRRYSADVLSLLLRSGHLRGNPSIPETQPTCLVVRTSLSRQVSISLCAVPEAGRPEGCLVPEC